MKTKLNLETWNRRQHYELFSQYLEPIYGLTVNIECHDLFETSKKQKESFYFQCLYFASKAANRTENFRLRVENEEVYIYDRIDLSAVIAMEDGSFGFTLVEYDDDYAQFKINMLAEVERAKNSPELFPPSNPINVIHFSSIPWLKFTSLSHARPLGRPDSCPKITFGKVFLENDRYHMPVSVHVHHALVDGRHIADFVQTFETLIQKL